MRQSLRNNPSPDTAAISYWCGLAQNKKQYVIRGSNAFLSAGSTGSPVPSAPPCYRRCAMVIEASTRAWMLESRYQHQSFIWYCLLVCLNALGSPGDARCPVPQHGHAAKDAAKDP